MLSELEKKADEILSKSAEKEVKPAKDDLKAGEISSSGTTNEEQKEDEDNEASRAACDRRKEADKDPAKNPINTNNNTNNTESVLVKSLVAVTQTQETIINSLESMTKSFRDEFAALSERIEAMEGTPLARKSIGNINVLDKNFNHSVGIPPSELSKSQIAEILTDEFFKGNPKVSTGDVIAFESGVPLRRELQELINNKSNQKGSY